MKITFLSTNDTLGGAAIVTYRLMEALRERGIDARMLVARRDSHNGAVERVGQLRFYASKIAERLSVLLHNNFDLKDLWKVSTGAFGSRVSGRSVVADADVVVINWINQGFLSLRQLRRICRRGQRVVWIMHDLWCATGICHIPGRCERFHTGCGQCPFLHGYHIKHDLSRKIWNRKMRIFSRFPIEFIAVSHWQRDEALKSPLLADKKISVLPHAFPVEEFTTAPDPAFKSPALAFLRDNPGMKYIVMGAANLNDPLKGLKCAVTSLNTFRTDYPDEARDCAVVFFGKMTDKEILKELKLPFYHTGMLSAGETRQLYASATVVLCTSKIETMGATLMEGMAAGAIPVTFDRGGQADIVQHGVNGYIAEYEDPESVAFYLAKAVQQPFSREEQHRSVADRFSSGVIADRFLELLKR